MNEIELMYDWEGAQLNRAKEILAFEVTKLVHGEDAAIKASTTAKSLFGSNQNEENMPTTVLDRTVFVDEEVSVLSLLVVCGLCESKSQARRLVVQGGVEVNSSRVLEENLKFKISDLKEGLIIKKGKKNFHRVKV